MSSQFEKGEVGVAIIGFVFTLLGHIVLEDCCSFWIVALETVEDGINVCRPFGSKVKRDAHGQDTCVRKMLRTVTIAAWK